MRMRTRHVLSLVLIALLLLFGCTEMQMAEGAVQPQASTAPTIQNVFTSAEDFCLNPAAPQRVWRSPVPLATAPSPAILFPAHSARRCGVVSPLFAHQPPFLQSAINHPRLAPPTAEV